MVIQWFSMKIRVNIISLEIYVARFVYKLFVNNSPKGWLYIQKYHKFPPYSTEYHEINSPLYAPVHLAHGLTLFQLRIDTRFFLCR